LSCPGHVRLNLSRTCPGHLIKGQTQDKFKRTYPGQDKKGQSVVDASGDILYKNCRKHEGA